MHDSFIYICACILMLIAFFFLHASVWGRQLGRLLPPPPPPSCTTCYCCYHRQHLQAATSYMTSIPFSDQPRRFLYGDGEDTRAHMADGWLLYCGSRNNLHGLAAAVANTGVRPTSDWLTALAWRRRSRTGHAAVSVIH